MKILSVTMDITARHMILDRIKACTDNNNVSPIYFSMNPNVTMSYVTAHPEIGWNWKYLSGNSGISLQDVIDYPEYPWNYEYLSMNQSIQFAYVMKYPDKP